MKSAAMEQADEIYVDDRSAGGDLRSAASGGILSIPVSVVVSVGKSRLTIDELLSLNNESVIALDAGIDDPVELLIGDRIIARGSLIELEGERPTLGVKISSIIAPPAGGS